jgi:flagellar motor switch/type III secretory pathway protein FliN
MATAQQVAAKPVAAQAAAVQAVAGSAVPTPGLAAAQVTLSTPADAVTIAGQTPALALPEDEGSGLNSRVAQLPVELDVVVPVRDFRVRNLLALQPDQVIESQWANGDDLPLASGAVRLAWGEFEVIDNQLAVRVTRLD